LSQLVEIRWRVNDQRLIISRSDEKVRHSVLAASIPQTERFAKLFGNRDPAFVIHRSLVGAGEGHLVTIFPQNQPRGPNIPISRSTVKQLFRGDQQ
jgi:hypothetical protein